MHQVTSRTSPIAWGILIAIGAILCPPTARSAADESPDSSGPIVLRDTRQGSLAWWVVDPETGMAAFYGGDIQEICENDPNMFGSVEDFSYLRVQLVDGPTDKYQALLRGDDVEASLWDRPPPFRLPQLCADILSRSPMAEGTARVKVNVLDDKNWNDPDARGRSVIDFAGQGSMQKADGEAIRVRAATHCSWPAGESIDVAHECRAEVDVR